MVDFANRITQTGRGPIQAVTVGEQSAQVHFNQELLDNPRVGPTVTALGGAMATSAETLGGSAPDLTHGGFAKLAGQLVGNPIGPAFRAVQRAVPAARADLEKRRAPVFQPQFGDDQPPAVRVEQRQFARSLSLPELMKAVEADPALAAAIVEGGQALSRLSPDLFERLRRDAAVARATSILTEQRTYATAPTADDPIGGEPDLDAARREAEALIAAYDAEEAALDTVPGLLANIVTVTALMLDVPRPAAFEALNG